MDADRFDTLTRSFLRAGTRRWVIATALSAGFLATVDTARAGKRKRCKRSCGECGRCRKGKCRPKPNGAVCSIGNCKKGKCSTCFNGVKDGNETDRDCGGKCPRCAIGRSCATRDDCASARCAGGTCAQCAENSQCGSDSHGACVCIQPNDTGPYVCVTDRSSGPFASCLSCRGDAYCYIANPGEVYCYRKLCGS